MGKSRVYFTKEITAESLQKIYEALGVQLRGRVAVKISTGEPGGHNFL
ncbi:MAG: ferredoxin, partial [Firmicutes bacterium]|nr:ferredoxin [Bacillota bacterium]